MRPIDADVLLEKAWDADTRIGYVQVVDVGDILDAPTVELEQKGGKEMDDLISRQDAIDALYHVDEYNARSVEAIRNLPSAQQWIPVSEGLPEYGEEVIADFRNEQIGRDRIGVSYCYVQKEGFFSDVPFEYKVVAWMPLPKPWRGEEDG